MGRVVQKYGGSSVADADSIKRVAKRIVATKRQGLDVVVVISAMGDTTDELMKDAGVPDDIIARAGAAVVATEPDIVEAGSS